VTETALCGANARLGLAFPHSSSRVRKSAARRFCIGFAGIGPRDLPTCSRCLSLARKASSFCYNSSRRRVSASRDLASSWRSIRTRGGAIVPPPSAHRANGPLPPAVLPLGESWFGRLLPLLRLVSSAHPPPRTGLQLAPVPSRGGGLLLNRLSPPQAGFKGDGQILRVAQAVFEVLITRRVFSISIAAKSKRCFSDGAPSPGRRHHSMPARQPERKSRPDASTGIPPYRGRSKLP
jgi:hypothetical protein